MKTCTKCFVEKPKSEFYKNRGDCKICHGLRSKAYVIANRDRVMAKQSEWVNANAEKVKGYRREWKHRNPDKVKADSSSPAALQRARDYYSRNSERMRASMKQWYAENKERAAANTVAWRAANRGRLRAALKARKAAKRQAVPGWIDSAKVQEFYDAADFLGMVTGEWYHVDHIVPLVSDIVCGLHCEQNLQVLPAVENIRKGNRIWPNMP